MSWLSLVAQAMVTVVLLMASPAGVAASGSGQGFDCQQLRDKPAPVSPAEWLARSLQAGYCYVFQARAVRISEEGVRTLALSHQIRNGFVHEIASYLDGPPVVYERLGRVVHGGLVESQAAGDASLSATLARIEQYYRLVLGDEERVAGRRGIRLDIEPLDALRYGHRLWLDIETALPLKQVLIDTDGNTLETVQMTELVEPTLAEQEVTFEPQHDMPAGPWRPGWLPAGYTRAPLASSRSVPQVALNQRLYSDGLSSFSLFVEPVAEGDPALLPGVHRLGVSSAAVRHLQLGERVMQVVVLGELPVRVLGRVAAQIEYQPMGGVSEAPEP